MRTARAIRQAYEQRFAQLGLNLSQASVLAFLDESGAVTQTNLATGLGLGKAAAGSIIDALQGRGLVERKPDQSDRRVWLVAVTDAGRKLAGPVQEIDRILRGDLRNGISRQERQQLAGLLVRLQSNLDGILDSGTGRTDS